MAKIKSPNESGSLNNHKWPYDNSPATQRARILKKFKLKSKLSTLELREMGVMHPAGRVRELRHAGHRIDLAWIHQVDGNGVRHRVGQYIYFGTESSKQNGGQDVTH